MKPDRPAPRQGAAYAYALTTVLIWSTVASAFKLTLRHLGVLEMLVLASVTSVVALTVVLALQGRLGAIACLDRRDLWISAGLGAINPFAYYLVLLSAYDLLPAQEAQALNYTWAITLALLAAPLLGQRLTLGDGAGLVVAYFGALVIATRGRVLELEFSHPLGVGLALGSTVLWALYWIANTRDRLDPIVRLWLNFAFGTLFVVAAAAVTGRLTPPPAAGLAGAVYIGVFEMGVAFALWIQALKLTRSTARISILIYLSPFLSLVFIHLLVGEEIYRSTLVGLVLIVAGLGIQRLSGRDSG